MTADAFWFLNTRVTVMTSGSGNADGISVLEHRMPFGEAPPRHVHHDEDEIFHVIEGEYLFDLDGARSVGRAGDTVLLPRGVPHAFRVTSPEGARCLTVTRGGFETMVAAMSRPATGPALPEAAEPTDAQKAALAEACAAQRIELLGPPLAA